MAVTFDVWYAQSRPRVLAAMIVAVGDVDRAAEATDEAMARALERWSSVQRMGSPLGWAVRVALNVARRSGRREALEARLLRRVVPSAEVPPAAGEAWLAVAELPVRQRQVLVLRYMLGLKDSEIAEALGISRSGVSSALTDARRKLGTDLAEPTPLCLASGWRSAMRELLERTADELVAHPPRREPSIDDLRRRVARRQRRRIISIAVPAFLMLVGGLSYASVGQEQRNEAVVSQPPLVQAGNPRCDGDPLTLASVPSSYGLVDDTGYLSWCVKAAAEEAWLSGESSPPIEVFADPDGETVIAWYHPGCGWPEGLVEPGEARPACGTRDTVGLEDPASTTVDSKPVGSLDGSIARTEVLTGRLDFRASEVLSGSSLSGELVLNNSTGETLSILDGGCAPNWGVVLTNEAVPAEFVYRLMCLLSPVVVPPGETRLPVILYASYRSCSQGGEGATIVACGPGNQMPPLPPGDYSAVFVGSIPGLETPDPISIVVT